VKQQNLDTLEDIVQQVSNPQSEHYGDYLHKRQLFSLVRPTTDTFTPVSDWLLSHDVSFFRPVPDWIVVNCNAVEAGVLLKTKFAIYQQARTNIKVVKATSSINVPSYLAQYIDFIGGATDFPKGMSLELNGESHSRALPSDPVIAYMLPGDTNVATFFLPICENGKTTQNAQSPCSDQGNAITSIVQKTVQLGKMRHDSSPASEMTCMPCSSWTSRQLSNCQSLNGQYSLPDSTVYCNSPLIVNLQNYYQVQYSFSLIFADNSQTADVQWTARPLYLGEFVTPTTLLNRYGVPSGREICRQSNNSQSVAEFSLQEYSPSDLNYFFQAMNVVPGKVEVNGTNFPEHPGAEATLDIEFIMGVAQNVTTSFWNKGVTFLGWIVNVLNSENPPLVHSVSYGGTEFDYSVGFLDRVNTEFQKAASRGLTILFASGDSGVNNADQSAPNCTQAQHFVPLFPASSPYVTAVGATQFSTQAMPVCGQNVIGLPINCETVNEIGCSISTGSRITSGGGFSDHFAMPSYQAPVVEEYLATTAKSIPSQYYNSSNRAYPDIAACGRNFLVYISGSWDPVDGTSAATPTAAGLITLANDYRIQNGLPVLGFINPLLYQNVYHGHGSYSQIYYDFYWDIVMGNNNCGTQGQTCCPYGWPAARGWDAITGLGSFKDVVRNHHLFPQTQSFKH